MWQTKTFKTQKQAEQWIKKHDHKYRMNLIFINNGFGVEYKKLLKISFD